MTSTAVNGVFGDLKQHGPVYGIVRRRHRFFFNGAGFLYFYRKQFVEGRVWGKSWTWSIGDMRGAIDSIQFSGIGKDVSRLLNTALRTPRKTYPGAPSEIYQVNEGPLA